MRRVSTRQVAEFDGYVEQVAKIGIGRLPGNEPFATGFGPRGGSRPLIQLAQTCIAKARPPATRRLSREVNYEPLPRHLQTAVGYRHLGERRERDPNRRLLAFRQVSGRPLLDPRDCLCEVDRQLPATTVSSVRRCRARPGTAKKTRLTIFGRRRGTVPSSNLGRGSAYPMLSPLDHVLGATTSVDRLGCGSPMDIPADQG